MFRELFRIFASFQLWSRIIISVCLLTFLIRWFCISKMLMLKFQLVVIWRQTSFVLTVLLISPFTLVFTTHILVCLSVIFLYAFCLGSTQLLENVGIFFSVDNSQSFHGIFSLFLIWGLQWHIYLLLLKSPCRSRCWDSPSVLSHSVLQFSIFINLIF